MFAALSVRNFRRYISGQALSLIGTWVETVAQALPAVTGPQVRARRAFVGEQRRRPVRLVPHHRGGAAAEVLKRLPSRGREYRPAY